MTNNTMLTKISALFGKKRRATGATDWFAFFAPRYLVLSALTGFVLRIILLCSPVTTAQFSAAQWAAVFGLGLLNDVAFACCALLPALLIYAFVAEKKYDRPWAYLIDGLMVAFALYVFFTHSIFHEYGSAVPTIAQGFIAWKLVSFNLRLFFPKLRKPWRHAVLYAAALIYVFCTLLNATCEYFFWEEFGVRYNFIAVDYLIYTNEVIGNIFESYPVVPLFLALLAVALLVSWLMLRTLLRKDIGISSPAAWCRAILFTAALSAAGWGFLGYGYRHWQTSNNFATGLSQNGCYDFLEAFRNSKLDYSQFYSLLPESEVRAGIQTLCHQDGGGIRHIAQDSVQMQKKNIILITIESLSADFLAAYGGKDGITPNLDNLLTESLVFDNLFATGNRTVRGLEAVTLCVPPSAGESIVKRPDCAGLFSTGSLLSQMGYSVKYIYGGDSYFDNMGAFFGGNGYEVIDRYALSPQEVTFENIWGVCDEDAFALALRTCDADAAKGKPFFTHIMTVSNHRPFTFPEGRIKIDGNPKSRAGAVKYTDYAIGRFLSEAQRKPWFANTVFVILADHCASSAGKTNLPLEKYHIPALIYAPDFIKPQRVPTLCSQIDLMPTLFALLGFSYDSRFYGQDILAADFSPRAFMATYQDLGYYKDDILTVLSPVRKVKQYQCTCRADGTFAQTPLAQPDRHLLREAQTYYQSVNLDEPYRPRPALPAK